MPLVLKKDVTFPVDVSVDMPAETGWETQTYTALCRPLTQSDIDGIYAAGGGDVDLLRRVVTGWKGVERADGAEVSLDDLVDVPSIRTATARAYIDALYRTKRGN